MRSIIGRTRYNAMQFCETSVLSRNVTKKFFSNFAANHQSVNGNLGCQVNLAYTASSSGSTGRSILGLVHCVPTKTVSVRKFQTGVHRQLTWSLQPPIDSGLSCQLRRCPPGLGCRCSPTQSQSQVTTA
jgi:hypothetical protein